MTARVGIATVDRGSRGSLKCRVGDFNLATDWEVAPGEIMVLFGPSGSGKTTTLKVIAGLVQPLEGKIEIGGRIIYDGAGGVSVPTHQRRVGYLTQEFRLFPHLNVIRNITYGLGSSNGTMLGGRLARLVEALGLKELTNRRTWELSGGQQQRVALARALAAGPEMLLLDEPFAALDAELRRTLRRELRFLLSETPIPVILVTHDREEALALGDSVQVLSQGRTIARGVPVNILGQPVEGRVARLVGVENLWHLRVTSRNPVEGTMVCEGCGLSLVVPLDEPINIGGIEASRDEAATIGIRSSDIILATTEPTGTSARNRLRGFVSSVEFRAPGYEVTLICGQPIKCKITGGALNELGIRPGLEMWAIFKASSCFLVGDSAGAKPLTESSNQ